MKTRIITAIVGILVLIGVMFTFNTMVFNLVIAAITLIAIHEIYSALGFEKKDWLMYAVLVPYTLLVMLSSYSAKMCIRDSISGSRARRPMIATTFNIVRFPFLSQKNYSS